MAFLLQTPRWRKAKLVSSVDYSKIDLIADEQLLWSSRSRKRVLFGRDHLTYTQRLVGMAAAAVLGLAIVLGNRFILSLDFGNPYLIDEIAFFVLFFCVLIFGALFWGLLCGHSHQVRLSHLHYFITDKRLIAQGPAWSIEARHPLISEISVHRRRKEIEIRVSSGQGTIPFLRLLPEEAETAEALIREHFLIPLESEKS